MDDALYVYGGHKGEAHSYHNQSQGNTLRRLDLKNPKSWEEVATGPRLQGLALLAHRGKLYRIGGFEARNDKGKSHDLWSQAVVAAFDLKSKKWKELPSLPEPRSSFDAAILNDRIYVMGGWKMAGEADSIWHQTAHVLDLSVEKPKWVTLPKQPFQRRALSVAAHDGKLFAIGGMTEKGSTTAVDIYDPAAQKWSSGPKLPGENMSGFGTSSFATGNRLYVSTYHGNLLRLSQDGKTWEQVAKLKRARFFHRMLPLSKEELLSVGGANMETGKFDEVDVIQVPK